MVSRAFSDRASSASSSSTDRVLFNTTLFVMLLARVPKRSVDTVSTALKEDGEQAIMSTVLELPLLVVEYKHHNYIQYTQPQSRSLPERVLQDAGELGVTVGHVCRLGISEGINHEPEGGQGLVDGLGLLELLPRRTCLLICL